VKTYGRTTRRAVERARHQKSVREAWGAAVGAALGALLGAGYVRNPNTANTILHELMGLIHSSRDNESLIKALWPDERWDGIAGTSAGKKPSASKKPVVTPPPKG
jgi:hypothetical protein